MWVDEEKAIFVLDSTDFNLISFFRLAASQTEVLSQSAYLNAEEITTPKQKNQSTSPNLPLNETIINEEEVRRAPRWFSSSNGRSRNFHFLLLGIGDADFRHSANRRRNHRQRRWEERWCHLNVRDSYAARPRNKISVEPVRECWQCSSHSSFIGDGIRATSAHIHCAHRVWRNDLSHWGETP